jgi:hypothetical protein
MWHERSYRHCFREKCAVAESVNKIVSPFVSPDRAVAVDRERDRRKDRDREEKKRGGEEKNDRAVETAKDAGPGEEKPPADEKVGRSLDIKV